MNEILLILSLIAEFSAVVLAYRFFGKNGLYAMTVFCTLAANIEVIILIDAFGIEQTLGNILFGASFLITDILSENEGKRAANKAVTLGICVSVLFILVSQSWLYYVPAEADRSMEHIKGVFSTTPRVMLASLLVYAVTQRIDVWLYHKWWSFTEKHFGSKKRFLWLRNNGSTMLSQLLNTILFNFAAFYGKYPLPTLLNICLSSYIIFFITALCDTPAVYIARRMKERGSVREE